MPSITELGQKVKMKYSGVYDDLSDIELGRKVKEKYPGSYDDFVDDIQAQSPQRRSFSDFISRDILGVGAVQEPETITRSLLQSTIGSRGIAGVAQLPGRVGVSFALAGSEGMIFDARARLSETTTALLKKIHELSDDDPRKEELLQIVSNNMKTLGISDETIQAITSGQITPGEAAGTALNAALTLGSGVGRTAVTGLRTLGSRALRTGGIFAGFTTAEGLIDDKPIDEIVKSAAISFGIGALGSGLFSAAVTLPLRATTSEKAVARLFRSGLGFGKASQVAEERQNKLVSEILIKEGVGTATQLKNRYQQLAREAEQQIQNAVKNSREKFSSQSIIREIVHAYKKQFPTSLTSKEIRAFVDDLPLAILNRKSFVSVAELNQLRREITNKMLSPTVLIRSKVQEGGTRQLLTAANVLSDKVKSSVPATREIFAKYSAYVRGFDALLNKLGATAGPVATGARIGGAAVGAFGGFALGGPMGGLAGVAAEEFARSTIGRTTAAVALRKLGIATEKLSQSEVVNLLNLLQKAGTTRLLSQ